MWRPIACSFVDFALNQRQRARSVDLDQEVKNVFRLAAPYGKHPVRRNLLYRLAVIVIHLELLLFIDGVGCHLAHDHALVEHRLAEFLAYIRRVGDHLSHDVARALERLIGIRDALLRIHKSCRKCYEQTRTGFLSPQIIGQRLEPFLARDGRLSVPLRLVRQVEVFQFALIQRALDARFQFVRQFALLLDRSENRLLARHQIAEIAELLLDRSDLDFIQIAGCFLAVARDERHSRAFVKQFDHRH
jgi:hypothetical protein